MRINGRMICFLVNVFLLTAFCSAAGASKIIYVDDDAAGLNDGTSWTNAHRFLQEALNDAKFAETPAEIRVAQGVYRPDEGLIAIPEFDWRTTTFQLINGVTLRGGYAGLSEADPNTRDIELYETILSGDLNGDDDPNFANNLENSYHVVTASATDNTAILDGFTITAGNANVPTSELDPNDPNDSYHYGGGVYIVSGNPVLMNCRFRANAAWNGGGMYNEHASDPILTNCIFTANSANWGSAMSNSWDSNPKVTHCTFTDNHPSTGGGGVVSSSDASPILTNCILWNDTLLQIAGDAVVTYSDIRGGWEGEGNIDADPLFADPNNGDYHLKSQAGRWEPVSESWVVDDVTSPCIDAGDPNSPIAFEPSPNGGIINMGTYGGTAEASKSPSGLSAKYGGGTGEPNDPYLIYTPEQMNAIGLHNEDMESQFKLMADIDLSGLGPGGFNMIGTFPFYFRGVFDGDGHAISNFTYDSADSNDVALLECVEGAQAEIRDLGLIDPNIDGGAGNRVAALVNYLWGGSITRCRVRGGRVSGHREVGGLVAYSQQGTITDSYSTASVTGIKDVGGLVGFNDGAITGCHAAACVTGVDTVGGLVGYIYSGDVRESSATGDVAGEANVGGLAGQIYRKGTIQTSYSASRVIAVHDVGGLVGRSLGDIFNCYSTGDVTGGRRVGGLVGFQGSSTTDSCYSVANIVCEPIDGFDGNPWIGGLVGTGYPPEDLHSLPSVILRSFWDVETCGCAASFGGTGLTTTEMQTAGTFLEAGWDFVDETANGTDDIWWIAEGQDYPRFWWEPGD
jgi:hypothetical protein